MFNNRCSERKDCVKSHRELSRRWVHSERSISSHLDMYTHTSQVIFGSRVSPKGWMPCMALEGSGKTFNSWDLLAGHQVISSMSLKGFVGSSHLPLNFTHSVLFCYRIPPKCAASPVMQRNRTIGRRLKLMDHVSK